MAGIDDGLMVDGPRNGQADAGGAALVRLHLAEVALLHLGGEAPGRPGADLDLLGPGGAGGLQEEIGAPLEGGALLHEPALLLLRALHQRPPTRISQDSQGPPASTFAGWPLPQ